MRVCVDGALIRAFNEAVNVRKDEDNVARPSLSLSRTDEGRQWPQHRGSSTGSSKKNLAKFSDTCSARADGLCIRLVGGRKAGN